MCACAAIASDTCRALQVTRGRKQAFCLMDSGHYYGYTGGNRGAGGHHCGNQGISVGWQDVYYSGLECQWIDITDVPNGVYTLQIELNAADPVTGERKVQELRYDNNVYRISVTVSGSSAGGNQCTVGEWGAWGECSVTCGGGGVRQRARTATGYNCPPTVEEVACNSHPCDGSGPVSTDGRCGNNSPNSARCPGTQCCSQYGWCGHSVAHCTNPQIPGGDGSVCGDNTCDDDENCSNCEADCGACAGVCGDNTCDADESCSSCEADCGACAGYCGDNTCDDDESCSSCSADCGACPDVCGDNTCGDSETCDSCEADCGPCDGGSGTLCQGCWPGTSGYCKGSNSVCYGYFPGSTNCPGGTERCGVHQEDIDCEVDVWSAWGSCSQECGGGTQTRQRIVLMPQHGNGAPCPSPLQESRSCNVDACDPGDPTGDIDCAVSDWGAWGECSVPCGGGIAVRRREVIIAPRGNGAACPSLEDTRECQPQSCGGNDQGCENCFPGTSGPCQNPANAVCYATYSWGGVDVCPPGTSRCVSVGSASADEAVVFSLTIGGVTPEQYMDASAVVQEEIARQLNLIPASIKVSAVSGSVVEDGDHHTSGRRLHGGHAPVPGAPTTTLNVEILAPQRHGAAKPATEIATDVQKTVGDSLMVRVLNRAGLTTQFVQLEPSEMTIQTYGQNHHSSEHAASSSAAASSSGGLMTVGNALIAVGGAAVGAILAVGIVVLVNRKRKPTFTKVQSFSKAAIAPRR